MKCSDKEGEGLPQVEKFNQPEAWEVKRLVVSSHALPDKKKFQCLKIISEQSHELRFQE